jgi:hypothetical protein
VKPKSLAAPGQRDDAKAATWANAQEFRALEPDESTPEADAAYVERSSATVEESWLRLTPEQEAAFEIVEEEAAINREIAEQDAAEAEAEREAEALDDDDRVSPFVVALLAAGPKIRAREDPGFDVELYRAAVREERADREYVRKWERERAEREYGRRVATAYVVRIANRIEARRGTSREGPGVRRTRAPARAAPARPDDDAEPPDERHVAALTRGSSRADRTNPTSGLPFRENASQGLACRRCGSSRWIRLRPGARVAHCEFCQHVFWLRRFAVDRDRLLEEAEAITSAA